MLCHLPKSSPTRPVCGAVGHVLGHVLHPPIRGWRRSPRAPSPRCAGGGPLTELAGSLLLLAGREVGRLGSAATRFVVGPASSVGLPSLRLATEGTQHDSLHHANRVVVRLMRPPVTTS
jgi:hypothetical protein